MLGCNGCEVECLAHLSIPLQMMTSPQPHFVVGSPHLGQDLKRIRLYLKHTNDHNEHHRPQQCFCTNLSTLPLVLNAFQLPTAAHDAHGCGVHASLAPSERLRSPMVDTRMQELHINSSS